MDKTYCPYCHDEHDIKHDDLGCFEPDRKYEQVCKWCDKNFTFTASIIYHYSSEKADCLNGEDHDFASTNTAPRERSRMYCKSCWIEREPTPEEMEEIKSRN